MDWCRTAAAAAALLLALLFATPYPYRLHNLLLRGGGGAGTAHWLQAGQLAASQQRWPDALDAFTHAAELDPASASIHFRHGFALTQMGRGVEAIVAYRRSLGVAPQSSETHFNLGLVLAELQVSAS